MMKHVIQQLPSLAFTEDVFDVLIHQDCLCPAAKKHFYHAIMWLDAFGLDVDYLGDNIRQTSVGWELVALGLLEWRFPFQQIAAGSDYRFEIIRCYHI